ncbi:hypothetical protein BDN70DRAFT_881584 [Pholiota conissans]|uniref:MYND-type domain-containing protein n=1 Tax=Pholiota conissans TaxID=109636 RepID=A0A9P5YWJ7_9AGAR|nr:hypothetical protein BDN70DRAFT_881584 [Pholiota conissans]
MGEQGVDVKKCAKCKVSLYCSKECQKKDWKTHKTRCASLAHQFSLENIVKRFTSTPFLWRLVEMACVLEFGLDKKPPVLDRPLVANCGFVLTIPAEDVVQAAASSSSTPIPTNTDAVIQARAFEAITGDGAVQARRTALWKKFKATNPAFFEGVTVVLVDFYMGDDPACVVVSVPISDLILGIVRKGGGFQHRPAGSAVVMDVEYSVPSCLSVLNHHIRMDESNKLGLRVPMSITTNEERTRNEERQTGSHIEEVD